MKKITKAAKKANKPDKLAQAQATAQLESESMRDAAWARLSEFAPEINDVLNKGIDTGDTDLDFILYYALQVCIAEIEQRSSRIIKAPAGLLN